MLTRPERAALLARSALHGRAPIAPTPNGLRALAIYHSALYRWAYTVGALALLALAFWEPPYLTASGSYVAVRAVDAALLVLAAFDCALQATMHGSRAFFARGWSRAKVLALAALGVNLLAVVVAPAAPFGRGYWARALRPLLFLERLRNVRKIAANVARSTPAIFNIGVLLLVHLVFFSILSVVLFAGIGGGAEGDSCTRARGVVPVRRFEDGDCPDDDPDPCPPVFEGPSLDQLIDFGCSAFDEDSCRLFFNDLGEASIQLFQLLAGAANYPNVMMPTYNCNQFNVLFFIAFITIGMHLLSSLVLAVAAAAFSDQTREEVVLKFSRVFGGLDVAFAELTDGDVAAVAAAAIACASGAAGRAALGAPATPVPAAPEATLALADAAAFFSVLRPDVPPALAARFAAAAARAPDARALTRAQFRVFVVAFARVRVRDDDGVTSFERLVATAAAAEGGGAAAAAAPPAPAVPAASARVLCCLRTCGRGGLDSEGPAPETAAEAEAEDAEWLDCAALGVAAGATAGKPAGAAGTWAAAVANPLAALAAEAPADAAAAAAEPAPGLPPPIAAPGPAEWGSSWRARSARGSPDGKAGAARGSGDGGLFARARAALVSALASVPPAMPPLSTAAGRLRQRAAALLAGPAAALVFDGAIAANLGAELWLLSIEPGTPGADAETATLALVQRVLLGVFAFELVIKAAVWGPVPYLRASTSHKFDVFALLVALLGGALELGGVLDSTSALAMQSFRALRLTKYLGLLPGYTATSAAVVDLLPIFARYALVLAATVYAFAIVGQEAFAGRFDKGLCGDDGDGLTDDNCSPAQRLVKDSSWGQSEISTLTFDTHARALVALWYILVLNDWPIMMEGAVAATQSLWARAYFVIYVLVAVVVVLNVATAFVIEAFAVERAKREALAAGVVAAAGVVDWRTLVAESARAGAPWGAARLARARHHADVYDALYRADVVRAFSDTLGDAPAGAIEDKVTRAEAGGV